VLLVAAIFRCWGLIPNRLSRPGCCYGRGIVIAGRHVHHFHFGIGLLTAVGGVAVHGQESARRHSVTADAYGAGAGAGTGTGAGAALILTTLPKGP